MNNQRYYHKNPSFRHTEYKNLLKVLETPNALKIATSKPHRREAEKIQDIIEKVWVNSQNVNIIGFAWAINDDSESLHKAIRWDRYFSHKYHVSRKPLPAKMLSTHRKAVKAKAEKVENPNDHKKELSGIAALIAKKFEEANNNKVSLEE